LHREIVVRAPAAEKALVRVSPAAHEITDADAVRSGGMLRQEPQGAGQFAGRTGVDVLAVKGHRAGGRLEEAGQAAEQGGLAAGVGADDHGHLALRDLHGEAVHHAALVVFQREVLGA
jgi:hypothetical protein